MSLLDRIRRRPDPFGEPDRQTTRANRRITRYIGAADFDPTAPDVDLEQKIARQERMRRVLRVISDNVSDQMGVGFRDASQETKRARRRVRAARKASR